MKTQRKYKSFKLIFCLIITLGLIFCSLSCNDSVSDVPRQFTPKQPISVAILFDASGTNSGVEKLQHSILFDDLTEYMCAGAGGNLRFNFVSTSSNFKGVELFIKPLQNNLPKPPDESSSGSSLMFTDEINTYNDTLANFLRNVLPAYDSTNKHKTNLFSEIFKNYLNKGQSGKLRNSSKLEYSFDRMIPFFESGLKDAKKYLILFSDGVSNDYSGYSPDFDTFSRLGVKTYVIGLDRKKARGKWLNIPFKQASYYDTIIYKILSQS